MLHLKLYCIAPYPSRQAPKCGDTLKAEATILAKLSDAFHGVFRCPSCKHLFSPPKEFKPDCVA